MSSFSHINADGNPAMVDVGTKVVSRRTARARSVVTLSADIMQQLTGADIVTKKGPVFQTAIAGTMAAKRTDELIPLCHSLGLDNCQITITTEGMDAIVDCLVSTEGKTGVEMEALVGASVAALTIYDMCKAFSHDIVIKETKLMEKTGVNGIFDAMTKLNGLVLAGGRSIRMGVDKSKLVYHGKPQREYLSDLLRPYCNVVFWSVNVAQEAELRSSTELRIVDAFDIPGPLNGILSAFDYDAKAAWLVVACDMPLLTAHSLDTLVKGRNVSKLATVFYDSDGQEPEPLLGIYEPAFKPILEQAMEHGMYSPRQLLQQNDVHLLTAPDVRELANINDLETRQALGL